VEDFLKETNELGIGNPFAEAGLELTDTELTSYAEEHYGWETDPPERTEPPLWLYNPTNEGNVIHLTRPVLTRINDATVVGSLSECDALLNMPVVVGTTDTAPYTFGSNWERHEQSWKEAIDTFLSRHPAQEHKGGNALFFAESQRARKRRNGVELCYKLEKKILNIRAVVADIDGGCTVEQVVPRLRELGLFAVIYTTHSHTTKGGPGSDRFRIILPLTEPFELGNRDADPEGWETRKAEWLSRYFGFLEMLIPAGGEIDSRGSLPSQMMHAPARPFGAEFKHYILAGRGVTLDDMPAGDVSTHMRRGPSGIKAGNDAARGDPARLSDGFDLLAWAADHGEYFDLSSFLEMLGWDVRGDAGRGVDILCPNAGAHTSGEDMARAAPGEDADESAIIYCHHNHCSGLYTCDFLRLIEEQITLPEGEAFTAILCDEMFYPTEVDGSAVTVDQRVYVDEEIKLGWLKTPLSVARAFNALPANAGAEHLAAIFAGIVKAGERREAVAKWGELVKEHLDANARKRVEKRGRELLNVEKADFSADKAVERQEGYIAALDSGVPDNVSLDPAEPLGNTMGTALATLAHRFAPVDLAGHFRILRKPDLSAFNSDYDATISLYRKEDFLNLHLDRQIMEGDKMVNPAATFLDNAKRKSGLVFAPPPTVPGTNDFNMYQGRKLKAVPGKYGDERDFPMLFDFLLRIVCDGSEEKLSWLLLWMSHLVQRPGEKPGTGVIGIGKGGIGKGRFGALLSKLAAPHFKQLENESHVIGQFAGEHLSKCVLVQVSEAVFGANPKVSSTLKALVDARDIQVEMKGYSLVTMPSFTRFYFDSNEAVPVLIEMNGSERRYFVLRFSDVEKGDVDYFDNLTLAIDSEEMAALLAYLERYNPASAGHTWSDVRTAPETPERRVMGYNSMRAAQRKLLDVLRAGEVTLTVDGMPETFVSDAVAGHPGLRVHMAAFKTYIERHGNKNNADDSDVPGMVKRLFAVDLIEKQGKVGSSPNSRWWHFPPEVLGNNVDRVLRGD